MPSVPSGAGKVEAGTRCDGGYYAAAAQGSRSDSKGGGTFVASAEAGKQGKIAAKPACFYTHTFEGKDDLGCWGITAPE